ncbi:4'-phosphopantetheinyl transferase sfp [Antarctobacter heliothermus]|uniref:4'-phosphopantetheinyl transferase sfp n=1 Tax=Antarctobacter heliothermus TaxID=74033 RepID=A0A222E7S6_9RHOB|nr:4'-phosphopantetheinyl transferase superfamily protein [Antarctobacter heliothermus]ASP22078.1 4'-phosphopantetheinyl transferase sfp [Antarctobacter heliothermus]
MTLPDFETALPEAAAPFLADGDAHVWLLTLDLQGAALDELRALLSTEERHRAAAFAFAHLQSRHVAAHGQMRRILAAYTGQPPQALRIGTRQQGKPYLDPEDRPAFNLSHSDGLGLLAVSQSVAIGADIERIRPSPDLAGIAETTMSPAESAALARLPVNLRTEAFFACWTRKEAVMKCDGRGFGLEPASFTVPVDPATRPDPRPLNPFPGTAMTLFDVSVPVGFRGAVAALPGIRALRFFRLPAPCPGC